jgi:uncharacterized protein with von Willebrand factor type A (vWA) domain
VVAGGEPDAHILMQRRNPQARNVAFGLAIDCSGSMKTRLMQTKETLISFMDPLADLGIDHGVVFFSDTNKVTIKKEIRERSTRAKRDEVVNSIYTDDGTDDLQALLTSLEMLKKSTAKQKVIFFLTDGAGNKDMQAKLQEIATGDKFKNILVIGIGVGPGCESVRNTYCIEGTRFANNGVAIPNVNEIPEKFRALMRMAIKGRRRREPLAALS